MPVFQKKKGAGAIGGGWRPAYGSSNHDAAVKDTNRVLKQIRVVERQKERKAVREGTLVEKPPAPVAIRPMVIDDAAYVLDSWANSYRRSPTTGPIEREVFNIEQRARINRLVSRPASRVFIACDAENTHQIRGWICFESPQSETAVPIVHYVCVQPAFQMQGIATALVGIAKRTAHDDSKPLWATHDTQPMRHIREKWNMLYNPYLLEVGAQR